MFEELYKRLPNIDKDNIREFYEERAGIREFDGGMDKMDAEREAFFDTIEYFYVANHILATTNV